MSGQEAPQGSWRVHRLLCGKCRTSEALASLCAAGLRLKADAEAIRDPRPHPVPQIDGQQELFPAERALWRGTGRERATGST